MNARTHYSSHQCREFFNYHLLKLDQSGLRRKLLAKWGIAESLGDEGVGAKTSGAEDDQNPGLGYDNLAFPFVLLCVGVLVAVLTIMLEYGKAS